jgi:PIN domain nuclease of toxin-antitoxin system
MLNLDTHVFLLAVSGDLRPTEDRLLRAEPWSISAIVLWEMAKLAQLGRIEVDLEDRQVTRALRSVHLWPITSEIARESTRLDVRGDPADELIGATSVVHGVPLITRDRSLLKSRKIPLARVSAR